jgi:hypothetical protein
VKNLKSVLALQLLMICRTSKVHCMNDPLFRAGEWAKGFASLTEGRLMCPCVYADTTLAMERELLGWSDGVFSRQCALVPGAGSRLTQLVFSFDVIGADSWHSSLLWPLGYGYDYSMQAKKCRIPLHIL